MGAASSMFLDSSEGPCVWRRRSPIRPRSQWTRHPLDRLPHRLAGVTADGRREVHKRRGGACPPPCGGETWSPRKANWMSGFFFGSMDVLAVHDPRLAGMPFELAGPEPFSDALKARTPPGLGSCREARRRTGRTGRRGDAASPKRSNAECRNGLARIGDTTPPCGVPWSRA